MTFSNSFLNSLLHLFAFYGYDSPLRMAQPDTEFDRLSSGLKLVFPIKGQQQYFVPALLGGWFHQIRDRNEDIETLILPIMPKVNDMQKYSTSERLFKNVMGNNYLEFAETPNLPPYIAGQGFIASSSKDNHIYMLSGKLFEGYPKPVADVVYIHPDNFLKQDSDPMSKFIVRKLIPACYLKKTFYDADANRRLPIIIKIDTMNSFRYQTTINKVSDHFEQDYKKCLNDNIDMVLSNCVSWRQ